MLRILDRTHKALSRLKLGPFFIRDPYYFGDLNRDPNLEHYPCPSGRDWQVPYSSVDISYFDPFRTAQAGVMLRSTSYYQLNSFGFLSTLGFRD